MSELVKVKARIKTLAERTVARGCSEAEAFAAAEMVGKLLETYNLSMDECDIRDEKCVKTVVPFNAGRRTPIVSVLMTIAAFCDCKTWTDSYTKVIRARNGKLQQRRVYTGIVFFGHESDTQLAAYMVNIVCAAMAQETKKYRLDPAYNGISSTISFQNGFTSKISSRLRAMKAERDAAMAAKTTGTALMVLKGTLIENEFKETGIRLVTSSWKQTSSDYRAQAAGSRAGDRVNLSRPLNGGGRVSGLLG